MLSAAKTKFALLTLAIFLLYGCSVGSGDCFDPGSGTAFTDVMVNVNATFPAKWVALGMSVKKTETVTANVYGVVNLCSSPANTVNVVVEGAFCADGSKPQYSKIPYPYSMNMRFRPGTPNDICPSGPVRDGWQAPRQDTGIRVQAGDSITLTPIPYPVTLKSCDPLDAGFIGENTSYNTDAEGKNSITFKQLCSSGGTIYLNGQPKVVAPYLGQTFYVDVGDYPGPQSNKYFHTWGGSPTSVEQYWFVAGQVDLRLKSKNDPATDKYDCTTLPTSDQRNKYLSTDLNRYCNRYRDVVTQGEIGTSSGFSAPYAATVRHVNGVKKSMVTNINGSNVTVEYYLPANGNDGYPLYDFDHLELSVGATSTDYYGGNPSVIWSNVLGYKPLIVPKGSSGAVMLALADPNSWNNFGGYNIKVQRTCNKYDGDLMYGYIGSKDPNANGFNKNSPGVFPIGCLTNKSNKFVFNQDNTPAEGAIYLFIDTIEASSGAYTVYANTASFPPVISTLITWILHPIMDVFRGPIGQDGSRSGGVTKDVYNQILNPGFIRALQALMAIFIALTAMNMLMGFVPMSMGESITRIMKMSLVIFVAMPGSYDKLNDIFFSIFTTGTERLIAVFSGVYQGMVGTDFKFLDGTIGIVLFGGDGKNMIRVLSMLLSGPIGWLYVFAIFFAVWELICVTVFAVIIYLISIIAVSLLISLAPLFIAFILFHYTKEFFDKWIRMLCTYATQPVFVFAVIGLGNELLRVYVNQVFNFGVCQDCLVGIYVGGDAGTVCLISWFFPMGTITSESIEDRMYDDYKRDQSRGQNLFGMPVSLEVVLGFVMLAKCLKIYIDIAPEMAASIFGTIYSNVGGVASAVSDDLKSLVGQDKASIARRKQAERLSKDDDKDKDGKRNRDQIGVGNKPVDKNSGSAGHGAGGGAGQSGGQSSSSKGDSGSNRPVPSTSSLDGGVDSGADDRRASNVSRSDDNDNTFNPGSSGDFVGASASPSSFRDNSSGGSSSDDRVSAEPSVPPLDNPSSDNTGNRGGGVS